MPRSRPGALAQHPRICYNCRAPGHKSRDCPEPPRPRAQQRVVPPCPPAQQAVRTAMHRLIAVSLFKQLYDHVYQFVRKFTASQNHSFPIFICLFLYSSCFKAIPFLLLHPLRCRLFLDHIFRLPEPVPVFLVASTLAHVDDLSLSIFYADLDTVHHRGSSRPPARAAAAAAEEEEEEIRPSAATAAKPKEAHGAASPDSPRFGLLQRSPWRSNSSCRWAGGAPRWAPSAAQPPVLCRLCAAKPCWFPGPRSSPFGPRAANGSSSCGVRPGAAKSFL